MCCLAGSLGNIILPDGLQCITLPKRWSLKEVILLKHSTREILCPREPGLSSGKAPILQLLISSTTLPILLTFLWRCFKDDQIPKNKKLDTRASACKSGNLTIIPDFVRATTSQFGCCTKAVCVSPSAKRIVSVVVLAIITVRTKHLPRFIQANSSLLACCTTTPPNKTFFEDSSRPRMFEITLAHALLLRYLSHTGIVTWCNLSSARCFLYKTK